MLAIVDEASRKARPTLVEVGPDGGLDEPHRFVEVHRPLVDAAGGQRIENVAHGDDACAERDRLAGEPVGVARAVPALVVRQRDLAPHGEDRVGGLGEDLRAHERVTLHLRALLVRERARLEEDRIGHAELAHVVHGRREEQAARDIAPHAHLRRDGLCVEAHALDVAAGLAIAELRGGGEAEDHIEVGPIDLVAELGVADGERADAGDRPRERCLALREGVDAAHDDGARRVVRVADGDGQLATARRGARPALRLLHDRRLAPEERREVLGDARPDPRGWGLSIEAREQGSDRVLDTMGWCGAGRGG